MEGVTSYLITVSPSLRLDEHLASSALPLPSESWEKTDSFRIVARKTNLEEARTSFLTCDIADTVLQHRNVILAYGLDFTLDSFFFREFIFALVFIASYKAKFHSFPAQSYNSRACKSRPPGLCTSNHFPTQITWVAEGRVDWPKGSTTGVQLLVTHLASASPTETNYWHENVLISLVSVTDGEATVRAAKWGIAQGKTHFQINVLSFLDYRPLTSRLSSSYFPHF